MKVWNGIAFSKFIKSKLNVLQREKLQIVVACELSPEELA
jgi:hypothetical protein